MKLLTKDLTDVALDWAVCISEGIPAEDVYLSGHKPYRSLFRKLRDEDGNLTGSIRTGPEFLFSRKWESGGPIIEREGIVCSPEYEDDVLNDTRLLIGQWKANFWNYSIPGTSGFMQWAYGSTPLIAAMRCFVASKLGDEVEIPEELL